MTKLRIGLVASEVTPFAKTGGLADVAAGLPRFLARQGHDVRVFMPMYGRVRKGGWSFDPVPALQDIACRLGDRTFTFSVSTAPLPDGGPDVFFVRCPELYAADDIYTADPNEHLRFAALSRAAIESCQRMQWGPDVFHCNDWHTGLLPLYLKTLYAWDRVFEPTRTILTIHNIGYQGVFSSDVLPELDLQSQRHLLAQDDLQHGRVNFLKTGLMFADALTTVSRTYAEEIQSSEYGMGLQDVIRARRDVLVGIVNGVDYEDWNPETDSLLAARYGRANLAGKTVNKEQLLSGFGLALAPELPLIGIVSRLTVQKGLDLLPEVIAALMEQRGFGLAVLGSGEAKYEHYFQSLRDRHPDRVAFYRGYNNELAHRIEAGSDLFLMPSRYEPCGLNQMYSLRYGTVPVVRRTGGLADTVESWDAASGSGTGFLFDEFAPEALYGALRSALDAFEDRTAWRRLMENGMAQDFSWDAQGRHYVELYRVLTQTLDSG